MEKIKKYFGDVKIEKVGQYLVNTLFNFIWMGLIIVISTSVTLYEDEVGSWVVMVMASLFVSIFGGIIVEAFKNWRKDVRNHEVKFD